MTLGSRVDRGSAFPAVANYRVLSCHKVAGEQVIAWVNGFLSVVDWPELWTTWWYPVKNHTPWDEVVQPADRQWVHMRPLHSGLGGNPKPLTFCSERHALQLLQPCTILSPFQWVIPGSGRTPVGEGSGVRGYREGNWLCHKRHGSMLFQSRPGTYPFPLPNWLTIHCHKCSWITLLWWYCF